MDLIKSTIKNLTIADTDINKIKELLRVNKEAKSEIDSIVGVSNTLSLDGMSVDWQGREVGEFHIECFMVVKHYKNERFESRSEYYVRVIRNEDNKEFLDYNYCGNDNNTTKVNVDYTNKQLEEFKMNYANKGKIHLPFFSIYSL